MLDNKTQQTTGNQTQSNTQDKMGQFKSFAEDFMRTGKDPQSVVQQLLQNRKVLNVKIL